jgi:hypothetical protein
LEIIYINKYNRKRHFFCKDLDVCHPGKKGEDLVVGPPHAHPLIASSLAPPAIKSIESLALESLS